MASRSNAIEEITRFWLQSRHGCLVGESIPVPVPYALSDIDIVAVTSDMKRRIRLPGESGPEVGPRVIVETKDEHDWEGSGSEFARLLLLDLGKMVGNPYIPKGRKGVKFTMLREEHYAKAKEYFGSEDFDRLFVVHALNWNTVGESATLMQQNRVHFVAIRDIVADLFRWYKEDCARRAGLRHTLVGDLWHLLVGFCEYAPPMSKG